MLLSFSPCFILRVFYSFDFYCQAFDPFFNLIFVYGKCKYPAIFLHIWISSFPNTVGRKDHPLAIERSQYPCSKSFDHICKGLFLSFLPLVYISVCQFCTVLITVALQQVLKSGDVRQPTLFLLFKIVLVIQGPLRVHMNLSWGFSILAKKCHWDFYGDYTESIDFALDNIDILTVLSLPIHKYGMFFPFICVF